LVSDGFADELPDADGVSLEASLESPLSFWPHADNTNEAAISKVKPLLILFITCTIPFC
jgi:hypothetical protein